MACSQTDNLWYHNSHAHNLRHQQQQHNSVPNSPNEMDLGHRTSHYCSRSGSNSANTSPVSANRRDTATSVSPDDSLEFNQLLSLSRPTLRAYRNPRRPQPSTRPTVSCVPVAPRTNSRCRRTRASAPSTSR